MGRALVPRLLDFLQLLTVCCKTRVGEYALVLFYDSLDEAGEARPAVSLALRWAETAETAETAEAHPSPARARRCAIRTRLRRRIKHTSKRAMASLLTTGGADNN